jgi:hypothetical protein
VKSTRGIESGVLSDERQFRSSSHREKVVEHVFLGELLRYLWMARVPGVQVLKPEVDAAGYDLVLSLGKVIRHVQLKASMRDASTQSQPIHASLGEHPSGCIIWIVLNEDLSFERFLWFGDAPGQPLPSLKGFKRAKHTRANAQGIKKELENTWRVPKSKFTRIEGMAGLVQALFGQQTVATEGA